jgi:uncharacterized protein (DUF433 family)
VFVRYTHRKRAAGHYAVIQPVQAGGFPTIKSTRIVQIERLTKAV